MTDRPRATVLTPDGTTPFTWEEIAARLAAPTFYWLSTIHPSGRPHSRPVLAVWVDGALHTTTGPATRKGRNLDADPRFSLTVSTPAVDLVVEGEADPVIDATSLESLRVAYADKYEWPITVVDGSFDAPYGAPTAGPPPYRPYVLRATAAYALGTDEEHAPRSTRFTW